MKLTETQIKIISAYQQELSALENQFKETKKKYDAALFLIAGREFKSYKIENDELIITDKEETLKEERDRVLNNQS